MHVLNVGLNHRTAPVTIRERIAVSSTRLTEALDALSAADGILEAVIVSTCNRAEVYTVVNGSDSGVQNTLHFFENFHSVDTDDLQPHLYHHRDIAAARHLFRVASGIDSLVVGESQILGQVKTAYHAAMTQGTSRAMLDELFRRALSVGKRARTETEIARGTLSVGSAAVELAETIFGKLVGHTVLLLGAGEMSELTARHLMDAGVRSIFVANRTYKKAVALANEFGGEAVTYDSFPDYLTKADIIISSTSAPHFVLVAEQVSQAMHRRRNRPLFLIDIAVPRDIDPAVHDVDNVYLYNIDDLAAVVRSHEAERRREVEKVEAIIDAEVLDFERWFRCLEIQPTLAALSQKYTRLREAEVERLLHKLPRLNAQEQNAIRAFAKSITNKILHEPLTEIRRAGEEADGYATIQTAHRLFNIAPTPRAEGEREGE